MIKLIHASKIYAKSGVCALDSVNLYVRRGEFVSIVGASGSGKSTLMNVLGLLDSPSTGRYLLGGDDVSRLPQKQLARARGQKIGFVFQRSQLVQGMNALENVALPLLLQGVPRRARLQRAEQALAAVGLSGRAEHRPTQLSGGQQQRVSLARAIVTEPCVLLADEPTAGLDPASAADVLDLLAARSRRGDTVVLITHDPAAAARATRRLRLDSGVLRQNPAT